MRWDSARQGEERDLLREEIVSVRAYTVADDQFPDSLSPKGGGWIDRHVASPMSKYKQYRATRSSWGINGLGPIVVEVESHSGQIGVGISYGGVPACWLVEHHLAQFVKGAVATNVEQIWDQMYLSTLHYGRKGLVVNAISAVDIAIWDLIGQLRQEPVYALIGGAVRDELTFYATGPRPDLAQEMGFIGCKLPLLHGPAEGNEGLRASIETAEKARAQVGDDFWLMYDAWMGLDVPYSLRLLDALEACHFTWLEEALPPDDYWGYAELRRRRPRTILIATGEHEATRYGFRMLLEMDCCDVVQPEITWCGGLTESLKIAALAESHNCLMIPHGASVYSYHLSITRQSSPFAEFQIISPEADELVPPFAPILLDEPLPVGGKLRLSDKPGFGVELNRTILQRPAAS